MGVVDPGDLLACSPPSCNRAAGDADHVHVVGVQDIPLETVDRWGERQLVVIHLGQDAAPVGSGSGLVPGPVEDAPCELLQPAKTSIDPSSNTVDVTPDCRSLGPPTS